MKTRTSTIYRQPKLLFDPALYETTQVFATSKDGTRVPMFISHKKGLVLDGTAPTLLYSAYRSTPSPDRHRSPNGW